MKITHIHGVEVHSSKLVDRATPARIPEGEIEVTDDFDRMGEDEISDQLEGEREGPSRRSWPNNGKWSRRAIPGPRLLFPRDPKTRRREHP